MQFTHNPELITLSNNSRSNFTFLPSGDVFELKYDDYLINAFRGNQIDGSSNNIYLRVYEDGNLKVYPLLGIKSNSQVSYGKNKIVFSGTENTVDYKVSFVLAEGGIWFWQVDLNGQNTIVDIVYSQDIGIAHRGGILTNELYMSQYLGHTILQGDFGYTVSSRQNMYQGANNPYIQQGCLNTKIIGYSTDATQFFGNDYRMTYEPAALKGDLPNVNYQFELSHTALQTEKIKLNGQHSVVFYAIFKVNMAESIKDIYFKKEIADAYKSVNLEENLSKSTKLQIKDIFDNQFCSEEFSTNEIIELFPERQFEECKEDKTLSFFTPSHTHVVLAAKEMLVERPHGHIITTAFAHDEIPEALITSTNYMAGIFNAQVALGNTSFHKFLSASRGFLNIQKNTGQRLYVEIDGKYRILAMPAAYEIGINFSKWFYKIKNDILIITSFTVAEQSELVLEVSSQKNIKYNYYVTNQLVMGEHEFTHPIEVNKIDNLLHITKATENNGSPYENINFILGVIGAEFSHNDDRVFFEQDVPHNGTLLTLHIKEANNFQVIVRGNLETNDLPKMAAYSLTEENNKYNVFYNKLFHNFHLDIDVEGQYKHNLNKLNETIWWYTHNALTHFAVPHGLEQPGGAAWGTRDVCQGPFEFFMATQNFTMLRKILVTLFKHQYIETREWPQWFMFDKYKIQADDCHGDVVFWPIKCVGDYIEATGDYSILNEECCYRHLASGEETVEKATILEHLKAAICTIEERFLGETGLISYAGGDWDDTLQPAKEEMKANLSSAWTVALAYQVINRLGEICHDFDTEYANYLLSISNKIKSSFNDLLIKDDVIAGFAFLENDNTLNYMLHPDDEKTGIHYRLLPLTRSIIAELVEPKQAIKNIDVINKNLKCLDGVRLMDRPANYNGGVCQYFERAEQAANVGREISLQYVHAHIRYIEAMAKLGKTNEAWDALFTVNPIDIQSAVPTACLRQSNTYFSSSEGMFNDRYDYAKNFDKLKSGDIGVKGGWRIYSSGPGIYLNQVISNVLGIRVLQEGLIIDPVLPKELDGLRFTYGYLGKEIVFAYHISSENKSLEVCSNGNKIASESRSNKYRNAGIFISKDNVLKSLEQTKTIDIYFCSN